MCEGTTKTGAKCKGKCVEGTQYCRMHGDGIISDLKNAVKRRVNALKEGPASKPTSRLQQFLDGEGQKKVVKLELAQKPIQSPLHKVLNAVSLGRFEKKRKELNYDDVYHNALIVTLADGRKYRLEKNAVVEHAAVDGPEKGSQVFEVPLQGKQLSLKDMVDNAARNNEAGLWKYRAKGNNCQQFTRDIIERNGLLPPAPNQDAKALVSTLPGGDKIPNVVTDTAAVIDRLKTGDGVRKRPQCPL